MAWRKLYDEYLSIICATDEVFISGDYFHTFENNVYKANLSMKMY